MQIEHEFKFINSVENVHEFHVWALSAGEYCLMVHLRTNGVRDDFVYESAFKICELYKIKTFTIQVESSSSKIFCPLAITEQ